MSDPTTVYTVVGDRRSRPHVAGGLDDDRAPGPEGLQ